MAQGPLVSMTLQPELVGSWEQSERIAVPVMPAVLTEQRPTSDTSPVWNVGWFIVSRFQFSRMSISPPLGHEPDWLYVQLQQS